MKVRKRKGRADPRGSRSISVGKPLECGIGIGSIEMGNRDCEEKSCLNLSTNLG